MKSTTCFGKTSRAPLSEYLTQSQADDAAAYLLSRHGRQLVSYRCDRCGHWHLGDAERQTPSTLSDCLDRNGQPKMAYRSYADAERRAAILQREHGAQLRAYDCSCGAYHLTSH